MPSAACVCALSGRRHSISTPPVLSMILLAPHSAATALPHPWSRHSLIHWTAAAVLRAVQKQHAETTPRKGHTCSLRRPSTPRANWKSHVKLWSETYPLDLCGLPPTPMRPVGMNVCAPLLWRLHTYFDAQTGARFMQSCVQLLAQPSLVTQCECCFRVPESLSSPASSRLVPRSPIRVLRFKRYPPPRGTGFPGSCPGRRLPHQKSRPSTC